MLEFLNKAELPLVFLEKPGDKEELTSCIDNFIANNINEGNMELEQQINELGEDDIQDDYIPRIQRMISSVKKSSVVQDEPFGNLPSDDDASVSEEEENIDGHDV